MVREGAGEQLEKGGKGRGGRKEGRKREGILSHRQEKHKPKGLEDRRVQAARKGKLVCVDAEKKEGGRERTSCCQGRAKNGRRRLQEDGS